MAALAAPKAITVQLTAGNTRKTGDLLFSVRVNFEV
jgi:hypothetical protein